jgi:hypothetical protein
MRLNEVKRKIILILMHKVIDSDSTLVTNMCVL